MKTLSIPSLPTPTIIQDYSCLAYWIKVAPIDRIIKNKLSGIARTFPISIFRVIPLLILIHIPAQIIPSRVWPKPSLLSSFLSSRPPQFAPLNRNEFLIFYQFPNQNQNHLGNYTNYAIMTSFQPLHSTTVHQLLSISVPNISISLLPPSLLLLGPMHDHGRRHSPDKYSDHMQAIPHMKIWFLCPQQSVGHIRDINKSRAVSPPYLSRSSLVF